MRRPRALYVYLHFLFCIVASLLHQRARAIVAAFSVSSRHHHQSNSRLCRSGSSVLLRQATSSSDLKQKGRGGTASASASTASKSRHERRKSSSSSSSSKKSKSKYGKDSVVHRLAQAAARASAAATAADAAFNTTTNNHNNNNAIAATSQQQSSSQERRPLASLRQLTSAIDKEIWLSRSSATFGTNSRSATTAAAAAFERSKTSLLYPPPPAILTDSMGAIFSHNALQQQQSDQSAAGSSTGSGSSSTASSSPPLPNTRHVAILLCKPLQDDQITVEGANRVRLLVQKLLQQRSSTKTTTTTRYNAICFVGDRQPQNHITDADGSFVFFRHLCASQKVSLAGIELIHLERHALDHRSVQHMIHVLQQTCLPTWREQVLQQQAAANDNPTTENRENNNNIRSFVPRKKKKKVVLRIHASLISSEYQLCQLNDIHSRSPNQSVLRVLETLNKKISSFNSDVGSSSSGGAAGVETTVTWSYEYTTTTTAFSNGLQAFLFNTYKTAQDLVPVLYNLRGVVDHKEFFQRDNYRVLVAARRSLVSEMEDLYQQQPSLRAVHQITTTNNKPLDVVLESALLSLGRCLDLVRPAGLLTGSVPVQDFKRALNSLQQAYYLLDRACDPDEPLDPAEWGKLDINDDDDDNDKDKDKESKMDTNTGDDPGGEEMHQGEVSP